MKKFVVACLLLLTTAVSACQSETQYGACVGVDRANERPNLEYRVSVGNVILGSFFVYTLYAPIIVLASEFYCPVGYKIQGETP